MKQKVLITSFFTFLSFGMFAQAGKTITISDGDVCLGGATQTDLTYVGTTGTAPNIRYTYSGLAQGSFGSDAPIRVIWSIANNRWEFQIDDGRNGYTGTVTVLHSNTTASKPNPPARSYGTWSSTAALGCDPLTVFSGTGTQTALLPIELVRFDAKPTAEGGTILTWATASEKNNTGFEVERSGNGTIFEKIAFLKGAGTTSVYQQYGYTDAAAPTNLAYYRLKQVDIDGTFSYSKVVSVSTNGTQPLQVYPNPVSSLLTIETAPEVDFQILNGLGQPVLRGAATSRIDVSALPQGAYLLQIGTERVKFLKQ